MFKNATGTKYSIFLSELHKQFEFDWYLEVGCRWGDTFAPVRSKTIAVDPRFRTRIDNVIGAKRQLHVMQMTSDAFFATGFLKAVKAQLSFSFLDGMHLFEFLLRDFMNAEKNSHPDGVIAMHDLCPFGEAMMTRDLNNIPRRAWTGDVWKLLPILKAHRPDLTITVLDAVPTGLVLVSGLDPKSTVLKRAYPKIVAEYEPLTLAAYGHERFNDLFDYTSTADEIAKGFPTFATAPRSTDSDGAAEFITP